MYRIGELARRYALKTDTLRFYDKHGLLKPSSRSQSGYRMYSEADAERLCFILRAKETGFSLTNLAEFSIHNFVGVEMNSKPITST